MGWSDEPDKGDVDELTKEFLTESLEGLDRMDQCLTELELRPKDAELLAEIFRSVHTIKGTTGFLGFERLEKLAHAGEHLLGSLRDGRLTADGELIEGLLQLMDGLRAILRLIEQTGKEGVRTSDNDMELITLLEELNLPAQLRVRDRPVSPQAALANSQPEARNESPSGGNQASSGGMSEKTLRIDVEVLNRMMNLVGELVLTRNQMLQSQPNAGEFPQLARRLDSVTADLRETVMQARMQPVGHLFGRFPRMVRDLAKNCGKKVRIEFEGQEAGLDKSLLEAIKDPLTHAVRNAVDHGIETAEERARVGKPAEGVVSLRARHQSGSVVIEVADDGLGISTRRVLEKAVERKLATSEQAAGMTEREALQMIFLPGFSTATSVTNVSGRGVGMDVVRANVERVGGTVEIESQEGRGTLLRLRVPLTLAIVPALVVRSGGQSFCLPQGSLAELVYVPTREAEKVVERMGGAELYRLRDTLLPMVWLDRLLGLDRGPNQGLGSRQSHGFYLAVLEAEGCQYGLVVDDLMAPEEIVVKPLSPLLREIGLFSGATVLGNGMLAMILDVQATAMRAGVRPVEEASSETGVSLADEREGKPSFLIFEVGTKGLPPEQIAIPLRAVERIERVQMSEVEYAGGRPLLQYRGELLRLEDTGGLLPELIAEQPDGSVTVLICLRDRAGQNGTRIEQRIGMVVRRVIDVSSGLPVEYDAELSGERLIVVKDRLTSVQEGFSTDGKWRDVA